MKDNDEKKRENGELHPKRKCEDVRTKINKDGSTFIPSFLPSNRKYENVETQEGGWLVLLAGW